MAGRCDECRARLSGGGHETTTRVLCASCYATLMGLAAGVVAAPATGPGAVEQAISTSAWSARIAAERERPGRDLPPGRDPLPGSDPRP